MKILITGGTGFVGTQLTSRLIQDGHELTILSRSAKRSGEVPRGISYLQGDPTQKQKGPWQEAIKHHDAVVLLGPYQGPRRGLCFSLEASRDFRPCERLFPSSRKE